MKKELDILETVKLKFEMPDHFISLWGVSKDIHHLAGQLRYMPRNAVQFYEQGPHMRFVLESLRMNKRRSWWRENIIVRLPSPFRMTHSYPIECRTSIDKIHEEKQIERLNAKCDRGLVIRKILEVFIQKALGLHYMQK